MESKKRKVLETDTAATGVVIAAVASASASASEDDVLARVEVDNEVVALRETLVRQQQTVQELVMELDEERNAAASAASEAMSMILRLQREKAEIQMELRQFKRFAEEKMAHDLQELIELDELVLNKEELLERLTFEVECYRKKLLSLGIKDLDDHGYPNLKCKIPVQSDECFVDDYDSSILERYTLSASRNHLKHLQDRIREMEAEKELVPNDISKENDCNDYTNHDDVNDEGVSNYDDNASSGARVYTVDAVHAVLSKEGNIEANNVMDGGDIKKLYMRLQALEADREFMRQTIMSMRMEKAQVVLLKEIAQQLCKEAVPDKKKKMVKKMSSTGSLSFVALIKRILSFIFWEKKAFKSRYSCGVTSSNVGLLLLLDKSSRNGNVSGVLSRVLKYSKINFKTSSA